MSDRNYWDRYARKYDASLRWVLGRPLPRLVELASKAVRGKRRVLEVAAGTGIVTAAIARSSETVIATDYAAGMVEVLTERIGDLGISNVTCEQADIYVPTFCHDETKVSGLVSRLLAISGFPGQRRFTVRSLNDVLEGNGVQSSRAETLAGLIPVGYVEGVFASP